jgi:hypothetical protein
MEVQLIELFVASLLTLAVIRLVVFVFVGDHQSGPAIGSLERHLDGSPPIEDGTARHPSRPSRSWLLRNGASNTERPTKSWDGDIW